ncbi:MAG: hypothetical protein WA005_06650 [Candidatus Binataceae bacterium]
MDFEFFNRDYATLIEELERFLGPTEIDRKLKKIDHALRHRNPLVAAYYGPTPKAALWLGLRKARQAVKQHSRISVGDEHVYRALDLAATLRALWPSTPDWRRKDLKSQLLSESALEPVLLEVKTALHLVLSGHKITWIEPARTPGVRTPDLVGEKDSFAFEVECKAQSVNEGRKVVREAMHDFCYRLATAILGDKVAGLWRDVSVCVPDRFPAGHTWQQDLVERIAAIKHGGNVELADGTSAKVVLRLATNHLPALAPGQFGHMCILTARADGSEPTLTIRVGSTKPDTMLAAIEEDLNDALGQFSGARPGKIVCYVPEIPSFRGMNTLDSGIAQMTYHFFLRHQRARIVFEVDYVSDVDLQGGAGLARGLHFLRFRNPNHPFQSPSPRAQQPSSPN